MSHVDLTYPRIATIYRDGNIVSGIALRSGPPDDLDKRQTEQDLFYYEHVPATVKVGMVKLPDGSFDWPAGHQNESAAVRAAREDAPSKAAKAA